MDSSAFTLARSRVASPGHVTGPGDDAQAELLARLRRRDERAFRELVVLNQGVVRAYATGLLRDAHEAEDAAQEVFLRAYRRLGAFRGDASLRTWLLRICRNHAEGARQMRMRHAGPHWHLAKVALERYFKHRWF